MKYIQKVTLRKHESSDWEPSFVFSLPRAVALYLFPIDYDGELKLRLFYDVNTNTCILTHINSSFSSQTYIDVMATKVDSKKIFYIISFPISIKKLFGTNYITLEFDSDISQSGLNILNLGKKSLVRFSQPMQDRLVYVYPSC